MLILNQKILEYIDPWNF